MLFTSTFNVPPMQYIISAVFDLIVAVIHFYALTHVGVPNAKILVPFFFLCYIPDFVTCVKLPPTLTTCEQRPTTSLPRH